MTKKKYKLEDLTNTKERFFDDSSRAMSEYESMIDDGLDVSLYKLNKKGKYIQYAKGGGIVKTATISFGQSMPEKEMIESQNATLSCDLFIAIGSSLQVYPAAGFPILAKRNGSKLIILNREPTDLDGYADLILNYEIGIFMNEVFSLNN